MPLIHILNIYSRYMPSNSSTWFCLMKLPSDPLPKSSYLYLSPILSPSSPNFHPSTLIIVEQPQNSLKIKFWFYPIQSNPIVRPLKSLSCKSHPSFVQRPINKTWKKSKLNQLVGMEGLKSQAIRPKWSTLSLSNNGSMIKASQAYLSFPRAFHFLFFEDDFNIHILFSFVFFKCLIKFLNFFSFCSRCMGV